jgi:hypothetical protein
MGSGPVEHPAKVVCRRDWHRRSGYKLGLSSVAVRCCHHVAGNAVGDFRTVIQSDEVNGEIDSRCHPARGEYVATVDVQGIRDDVDRWELPTKPVGEVPMSGRSSSIEEPGIGEHQRANTKCHHPDATPMRVTQSAYNTGSGR